MLTMESIQSLLYCRVLDIRGTALCISLQHLLLPLNFLNLTKINLVAVSNHIRLKGNVLDCWQNADAAALLWPDKHGPLTNARKGKQRLAEVVVIKNTTCAGKIAVLRPGASLLCLANLASPYKLAAMGGSGLVNHGFKSF